MLPLRPALHVSHPLPFIPFPRLTNAETSPQIEDGVGERGGASLQAVLGAIAALAAVVNDSDSCIDLVMDGARQGGHSCVDTALSHLNAHAPAGGAAGRMPERHAVDAARMSLELLLAGTDAALPDPGETQRLARPLKQLSAMLLSAVSAARAACESVRSAAA